MSETFPTQIHKLVVLIVDHDEMGADEVKEVLENQRYPNHCISPNVMQMETRTVEWADNHPLNSRRTREETFGKMFADPTVDKLRLEVESLERAYGEAHASAADFADLVRQQTQRIADLRLALQAVLNSAVPNERDHPAMSRAWKNAQVVLDAKDPR